MRISTHHEITTVTLKVEGTIRGPFTAEFARAWRDLAPTLGAKQLSIDLRGVTYVDQCGQDLLSEIYQQTGASFITNTPLTRYFAEQAQAMNLNELTGVVQ